MKYSIVALIAAAASIANAQVTFNDTTNTFTCSGFAENHNFCAGDSLATNIIIRCTGTVGQPGNCNDNLAGIPPVGVKTFAPCYQTSNTSGDAVCSFNGIGYPEDGSQPFPLPGVSTTSSVTTASSTSSSTSSSTISSSFSTSSSTSTTTAVSPVSTTITTITTITSAPVITTTAAHVATGTGGVTTIHGNVTVTTGLPKPTPVPGAATTVTYHSGLAAAVLAFAAVMLL